MWGVSMEDIQNEVRAAVKLCEPGTINIVSVLRHGKLPSSPYYFIDMELCDLNLATYIYRKWVPGMADRIPNFVTVDQLEPKMKHGRL